MKKINYFVIIIILLCIKTFSLAQNYKLLLPPNYEENKKYPIIVFLPGIGNTSEEFFKTYLFKYGSLRSSIEESFSDFLKQNFSKEELLKNSFILLIPNYKGSLVGGFNKQLKTVENMVMSDLNSLASKYSIDKEHIIITGFSLGGDLSFAIGLRNPKTFCGAIIMSSRCSYRTKNIIGIVQNNNFKFYFTMGDLDERKNSMNKVIELLDKNNIIYQVKILPYMKHQPADAEEFLKGICKL